MELKDPAFATPFDAVVMLTVSDWKTEPRSNRYHYATRFAAAGHRVIFVQPDRASGYQFEPSGIDGIELLHVPEPFGPEQSAAIALALSERRVLRPLLWIYSANYIDAVVRIHAPLRVLHATEDYFMPELRRQQLPGFYERLGRLFARLDLLVAVSQGVLTSYQQQGGYRGEALLLENGCDFKHIREIVEVLPAVDRSGSPPLAFYQGGINYRLDFALLLELARSKRDWSFEFCGKVYNPGPIWKELLALPNVHYVGELAHEEVMERAARATVGLMPFCQVPFIQKVSLPLKAFEYAACGLPVVTVPIDALVRWPDLFLAATDAAGFGTEMERARAMHADGAAMRQKLALAAQQDYDGRFRQLEEELGKLLAREPSRQRAKLNVLVLYSCGSTYTPTVLEYLSSFARFSAHHVTFADAVIEAPTYYDMSHFDVIVVHYSVRLTLEQFISPAVVQGIKASGAFRILTIQDEYDEVGRVRNWIGELGFHAILTCIPDGQAEQIYPRERFPGTELIPILTGYVPEVLEQARGWKPLRQRPITIGYRGRRLPFRYGRLAQEKYEIGLRMRAICEQRGIDCDIEWEEDKRIYGDRWYEFIGNCRAMLGSESGSNAFDFDGTLMARSEELMQAEPDITYEEFHERLLEDVDGEIRMNQVSARVFEAIALGTPLILFEGQYSGAVRPHEHYLPLKKDYSNVEEIFRALEDFDALEAMTQRAYRDVIASGHYSYRSFVGAIDAFLNERVPVSKPWLMLNLGVGFIHTDTHDDIRIVEARVPRGSAINWPVPYKCYDENAAAAMQVLIPGTAVAAPSAAPAAAATEPLGEAAAEAQASPAAAPEPVVAAEPVPEPVAAAAAVPEDVPAPATQAVPAESLDLTPALAAEPVAAVATVPDAPVPSSALVPTLPPQAHDLVHVSWKVLAKVMAKKAGRRVVRHAPSPLRTFAHRGLRRIGRALHLL
jgi:glycosyltransferase involved in cell wall biosynthesis